MPKRDDLAGEKYGRWNIESYDRTKNGKAYWNCICECGKRKSVAATSLKSGLNKSCGCLKIERIAKLNKTHHKSKTAEYKTWCSIKDRCYNSKSTRFKYYGALGIQMAAEWINNFESFYSYIGPKPSPKHSVDRFPNAKGNYEPGNIRWATQFQQLSNFSRNVHLEYDGHSNILAEWARLFKVKHEAIRYYLKKGLPFEQIAKYFLNKLNSDQK